MYFTIACILITVAHPFVTISFIRNYRQGLMRMLRLDKEKVTPMQTCDVTGASALTLVSDTIG